MQSATIPNAQFMNQVHGDEVVVITEKLDSDPTCDAMITTQPGIALAVMVADCVPLLDHRQHEIQSSMIYRRQGLSLRVDR